MGNNDMMQCVTKKNNFLICMKTKSIKKMRKNQMSWGARQNSKCY
jgi:hypothetical protein